MQLHDALESVSDSASFLAFVRLLAEDRADEVRKEAANPSHPYGPGANGWENVTIEAFLEAALSWADSTNIGLSQGLAPDNPWKRFAVFLYCGKIYE
jgi:hypothetical protein